MRSICHVEFFFEDSSDDRPMMCCFGIPRLSILLSTNPYAPWDWYIYLHEWLICMVKNGKHVGKYTTHEAYGQCWMGVRFQVHFLWGLSSGIFIHEPVIVYSGWSRQPLELQNHSESTLLEANISTWNLMVSGLLSFWVQAHF